jgi:hypothetical protein
MSLEQLIQHIEGLKWQAHQAAQIANNINDQSYDPDGIPGQILDGITYQLRDIAQKADMLASEAASLNCFSMEDNIHNAISQKKLLRMAYTDAKGATSIRTIKAINLSVIRGYETLTAWCHEKNAMRHFRLDRIESLRFEGGGSTASSFEYTGAQLSASFGQLLSRPRRAVAL